MRLIETDLICPDQSYPFNQYSIIDDEIEHGLHGASGLERI